MWIYYIAYMHRVAIESRQLADTMGHEIFARFKVGNHTMKILFAK